MEGSDLAPKSTFTPEEWAELTRLFAEYEVASARAAAALRTNPPTRQFGGMLLESFLAEDAKVAAIVRQIKEITGAAGKPWSA